MFQCVTPIITWVSCGFVSFIDYSQNGNARKSFFACCFVQGAVDTYILIPCWRSIHLSN